jgi:murein DD-endopeptidase MepM/ murein hydrolase activator NlpD
MVRTAATVGQKVSRGEVIGYTGGSGSSGQGAYDEHLHFEIHQPGEVKIDPASCYNGLSRVFKNQLDA